VDEFLFLCFSMVVAACGVAIAARPVTLTLWATRGLRRYSPEERQKVKPADLWTTRVVGLGLVAVALVMTLQQRR